MPSSLTPSTVVLLLLPPLFWAGNAVVGRALVGHFPPLALSFARWASPSRCWHRSSPGAVARTSRRDTRPLADSGADRVSRRRLLQLAAVPRAADVDCRQCHADRRLGPDHDAARRCRMVQFTGPASPGCGRGTFGAGRAVGHRARRTAQPAAPPIRHGRCDHAGRHVRLEHLHVAVADTSPAAAVVGVSFRADRVSAPR